MALSEYSELLTAVQTWRERIGDSVISGNAADCIKLAEARLTRKLPLREMWINEDLFGSVNSREVELPTDYVESRWLKVLSGSDYKALTKRSSSDMLYETATGEPTEWALNGLNIDLNKPTSLVTFQFRYRQKFDLATTETNWLLTNHPDVYLAAVLVWSGLLIKDDDVAVWKGILEEAMNELAYIDAEADGGVEAQLDAGVLGRRRYGVSLSDFMNG